MTREEKIKVLAELDGLSDLHWDDSMSERLTFIGTRGEFRHKIVKIYVAVPDYLTSYDAIIPLVKKCWEGQALEPDKFYKAIRNYCPHILTFIQHTSPQELADALIKAVGKWRDDL